LTDEASSADKRASMAPDSRANLLSAAGYLCCAVDDLRAAGLETLADEIDSFITTLDARIEVLSATPKDWSLRPRRPRVRSVRRKAL
jgi:hypothetical protein